MESAKEAHLLVTELYDPANQRNPSKVNEIQARLQQLQKGEHGWMIADVLLREPSTHHRFIGALTFTVKINVSGKEIKEDAALEAMQHLVNHFVALVTEGEQAMVIRKLASSLVALFMQPATPWKRAVLQLAASLANGGYMSEDGCRALDFQNTVIPALSQKQVMALLFFSNHLAEETMRLGGDKYDQDVVAEGDPDIMHDRRGMSVSVRVAHNIRDAFLLSQYVLRQVSQQATVPELGTEAMNSWKTWLVVHGNHPLPTTEDIPDDVSHLKTLCAHDIIEAVRVPDLRDSAVSVLTSVMESRLVSLDSKAKTRLSQILIKAISAREMSDEEEDGDHLTLIDLLVAFAYYLDLDLFREHLSPPNSQLLEILHNVFKSSGYAATEDMATPRVLEFWNETAEYLPDKLESDDPLFAVVKDQLAAVVLGLFNKLLYPDPEHLRGWTDEERSEFNVFRFEGCDYLLSIYQFLGVDLIRVFQESATSNLSNQDWRSFETAMFCLTYLSEAVDENGHADECLDAIFGGNTLTQIFTNAGAAIPLKARQTLVDAIGKYESYFKRHTPLLPGVLTILFESLNFEPCAQTASRSIQTLARSCSQALIGDIPVFLDQLDQFRVKPTATVNTMPRVLQGIAAIIYALPQDQDKVQPLERILRLLVQEAHTAREEGNASAYESARARGDLVLSCIASVGKGLQSTEIELTDDEVPEDESFWSSGPGTEVQRLIMEAMRLLIVDFPVDISIIEAACEILRAGYTEKSGPFVFPPSMTVDFIKSFPLGISGTDIIMATASSFLASYGSHSLQIRDEAVALISHVAQLFYTMLETPDLYDPETANAGIDFLERLLPRYHPVLFSLTSPLPSPSEDPGSQRPPILAVLVNFTLHALSRPEPLPIRSASTFWANLLALRPSASEDTVVLQQVLEQFMPSLCHTLIQQIAGRCARSDLVSLTDVLRRGIFKHMTIARPSLTAALDAIDAHVVDANGQQVPLLEPKEKSRFLESLFVARGARQQSLDLVRTFWLKCRGLSYDYAR
ncbi:uncharacterized protein PFLUO_LOCUS6246 [Penicillium psychrofluorescens]|uniref:uncharacterized protein n=1 Tax=Penicillium psychrofluorescens TaxID=3158075 RepID=UPI003CCE1DCD